MLHKAFIDVDEEGTEAAAVTGMGFGMAIQPPRAVVFRADHPFVYLIRDCQSGAILFAGRLAEPKAADAPPQGAAAPVGPPKASRKQPG